MELNIESASASASASKASGPCLPLDLVIRASSFLPPNEISGTVRVICKASAQNFSAPHHRTVRLSQPVPPHAFAPRYGRGADPGPLNELSFDSKNLLLALTATSGCIENVATLVERMEPPFWWGRPYQPEADVCAAAARSGHMHVVRWLLQLGYPLDAEESMAAVAEHCSLADVLWLLAQEPVQRHFAFRSQHMPRSTAVAIGRSTTADVHEKLEWLSAHWQREPAQWQSDDHDLQSAVAAGAAQVDNLPALQWGLQHSTPAPQGVAAQHDAETAADWQSFLSGLTLCSVAIMSAKSGAVSVTAWLLSHRAAAYSELEDVIHEAAAHGHSTVLRLLLPRALEGMGGAEDEETTKVTGYLQHSASSGCLGALKVVWEVAVSRGVEFDDAAIHGAFEKACASGSVETARWLRQQRPLPDPLPPTDRSAMIAAVKTGGAPMLEFLCNEAGAAWNQGEATLEAAVCTSAPGGAIPVLRWLQQHDCAVNYSSWCADGRWPCDVLKDNAAVLRWLYGQGLVTQEDIQRGCSLDLAASTGCVAAMEWLASLECSACWAHESAHQPYITVGRKGDLDMLRCLRRLHRMPYGSGTVERAVEGGLAAHVVRWMVEEGGALCNEWAVEMAGFKYRREEGTALQESLQRALISRLQGCNSGLCADGAGCMRSGGAVLPTTPHQTANAMK